jgi:uncharacterized membrane protein
MSMYFLFVFLPSACTSCFYSFLQHALLVFIPSFSMHFLSLIRPSVYTSFLHSFLHLVLLVQEEHAEESNTKKKYMLKEGIKARNAC